MPWEEFLRRLWTGELIGPATDPDFAQREPWKFERPIHPAWVSDMSQSCSPEGEASLVIAAAMGLEAFALRRGAAGARIVRTGVGPVRAQRAVASLRRDPATALAIAGLAGSLDASLRPGDVVVASSLSELSGDRCIPVLELDSAERLARCLEDRGQPAVTAPLLSADHIVRGRERERLRESGARLIDMESAWLAEAAAGRPLAVLRVIVDAPDAGFSSLSFPYNGVRALIRLCRVARALEAWAAGAIA